MLLVSLSSTKRVQAMAGIFALISSTHKRVQLYALCESVPENTHTPGVSSWHDKLEATSADLPSSWKNACLYAGLVCLCWLTARFGAEHNDITRRMHENTHTHTQTCVVHLSIWAVPWFAMFRWLDAQGAEYIACENMIRGVPPGCNSFHDGHTQTHSCDAHSGANECERYLNVPLFSNDESSHSRRSRSAFMPCNLQHGTPFTSVSHNINAECWF